MICLLKTIRSYACLSHGSVCGNLKVAVYSKPDMTLYPGRPWYVLLSVYFGVNFQIPVAWIHTTVRIKRTRSCSLLTNKLRSPCAVIQYAQKANCTDPSCKSWLLKKVESQSRCKADFSLLRGDCNPGDASVNGRKPEPDTGIKVGVADGWKCSTSTCQAIPTAINYMFTTGCGSLHSPTFLLMSAAHYHI